MLLLQNILSYVLIFAVVISACAGQQNETLQKKRSCAGTCMLQWRCTPYYKDLVWTIVDGCCEVYQNGCLFGNKNCIRANSCLQQMTSTDKVNCQQYCPTCTGVATAPVCGVFAYVAPDGTNSDEYITFDNLCKLRKYACNNAKAYFYYNNGAC